MDEQTRRYYEDHAEEVGSSYESAQGGVLTLLPVLFRRGDKVLDIGAGSGRDAAALLALGADVQVVEPSAGLRRYAERAHPELRGRIFDGALPERLPDTFVGKYDAIVLSAVIMHIPNEELFDTAFVLRGRLGSGGRLLLSFPEERGDIVPGSDRDKRGRLMVSRSAEEICLLFERLGFTLESEWTSSDSLARKDVLWKTVFLRYGGTAPRPIDRVESILNRDRKTATYKFALIRALCDFALLAYNRAEWRGSGDIGIPLSDIADRWIEYYWPIIESDQVIPQINAEDAAGRPLAFRDSLGNLVRFFKNAGGRSAFLRSMADGTVTDTARRLYKAAAREIEDTIKRGPVRYAGGAVGRREFEFDSAKRHVVLDQALWRDLALMAHWIRDAVLLRWAQMTHDLSHGTIGVGEMLEKLVAGVEDRRQDELVRAFYAAHRPLECVWSGKTLAEQFDVDHAVPYALWQDSSIWNLFPADKKLNNSKRDQLPTAELLRRRRDAIVHNWGELAKGFPMRFGHDAAVLAGEAISFGTNTDGEDWRIVLFSRFFEAVEYTATTRGAERWQP